MPTALPVWVEIHVDDEIVERDPTRWPDTRDLLDAVAGLAEARGARLCFRIREPFATASRHSGFLPALAARGHEIGVHAHGRGLAAAVAAVRACGVTPAVAVPGLVQAGPGGRSALLRQVASLGLVVVTDHGAEPAWAYDGLVARREHGVLVVAPTVRPFDWHLMERDGTRHGVTPRAIARLRELEGQAREHGAGWFGLALHEHDLCPPADLRPLDAAMAALGSFLDDRVVPALSVLADAPAPGRAAILPLPDVRVKAARAVHRLARRLPAPQGGPSIRQRLRRSDRGAARVRIHVDTRYVVADHHRALAARAAVVLCHAGAEGGRRLGLRPFGLRPDDLLRRDLSVWLYDRSGTGRSPAGPGTGLAPGNPDHVRDWCAVLDRARADGLPVLALTWSGGIVPVMAAAANHGARPDALLDAEGPVDRWSLVPPASLRGPQARPIRARDPWQDALWADAEAVRMVDALGVPYARLQGDPDHVHGSMVVHAQRLVTAAVDAGLPVRDLHVLSRPLRDHPDEVLDALDWALQQLPQGWFHSAHSARSASQS